MPFGDREERGVAPHVGIADHDVGPLEVSFVVTTQDELHGGVAELVHDGSEILRVAAVGDPNLGARFDRVADDADPARPASDTHDQDPLAAQVGVGHPPPPTTRLGGKSRKVRRCSRMPDWNESRYASLRIR